MDTDNKYIMGIISAPEEVAEGLAGQLVQQRLAACAQVTGRIKSFYWWDDKVNADPECLIYLKTVSAKVPLINKLLKEQHPYEVPEFITISLLDGNPEYFHWIEKNTAG